MMKKTEHRASGWTHFVLTAGFLVLAGCGSIIETAVPDSSAAYACSSETGAYFLPKKVLRLTITQATGKPFELTLEAPSSIADRDHLYCLDYLGSAAAADTLLVKRSAEGLLKEVAAIADDKTKSIALTALDIGLVAVTGNPAVTTRNFVFNGTKAVLADFQFDPFDWEKMIEINTTLLTYGFCVLIDGRMQLPRGTRIEDYCNNPGRFANLVGPAPNNADAGLRARREDQRGILYRTNFTHNVVVLRKTDPGLESGWEIYQSKLYDMPNLSPTFSIAVDRSFMVKKQTKLSFTDGVLDDVTIDKPSEMLEFSELPLKIAQAIVAVPGQIIKVRISNANNRQRIIQAQSQLLATQRSYTSLVLAMRQNGNNANNEALGRALTTADNQFTDPRSLRDNRPDNVAEFCGSLCGGIQLPNCSIRCPDLAPQCKPNGVSYSRTCVITLMEQR